jgi:hypothetical protein
VPPLQNKYLAFNAFWELGEKLELGFMALLGESFSVINEPAQQALSYYTIHEFWAHVPHCPSAIFVLGNGHIFHTTTHEFDYKCCF